MIPVKDKLSFCTYFRNSRSLLKDMKRYFIIPFLRIGNPYAIEPSGVPWLSASFRIEDCFIKNN